MERDDDAPVLPDNDPDAGRPQADDDLDRLSQLDADAIGARAGDETEQNRSELGAGE